MMTLIRLDKARPRTANVPSANQQESLYIPPLPCGRWTLNRKHSEYCTADALSKDVGRVFREQDVKKENSLAFCAKL